MITFYSFCWSVIISSICIIILILFRRNSRFLLNFNLPTLLFLFLLCMIRMLIPFEFLNITGTFTPPVRNEETIVPD